MRNSVPSRSGLLFANADGINRSTPCGINVDTNRGSAGVGACLLLGSGRQIRRRRGRIETMIKADTSTVRAVAASMIPHIRPWAQRYFFGVFAAAVDLSFISDH